MEALLPLAAKSLLIAGAALLVLKLMQRRSAADRSFIAHLGLASIAMLPLAWLLLPPLEVGTPWLSAAPEARAAAIPVTASSHEEVVSSTATFPGAAEAASVGAVDWLFWAYAAPAALLVLLTLIALGRLVLLKAKANVLVEPNWLTALARAQRRMGFKHGTALLTSDDLRSPISWGLMRPVILLNSEAAEAHAEAEAIIAHELAHVARLDWVKLLLSRITVALFWFNPLVWVLAREAHQLREEAADDAVLGSDIEDTEYARLLVGIARHECRGLLLGAHGVAPARTSLARRVRRVLDAALERAPGGWRWTAAAGFFAAGMAVPLATLHLVPMTPATAAHADSVGGKAAATVPSSLPQAAPAREAVSAAAAAAAISAGKALPEDVANVLRSPSGASISTENGQTVLRSSTGGVITIAPPAADGRRRTVIRSADGSTVAFADARAIPGLAAATAIAQAPETAIDRAIERKAVGMDRHYVAAMRNAAPRLRLDHDSLMSLKALGVTPEYLRDLAGAGLRGLTVDDVIDAKAIGINGSYARSIVGAGYANISVEDLVEMKAVGVTATDVARYRQGGRGLPSVERMVELKALGIDPAEVGDEP